MVTRPTKFETLTVLRYLWSKGQLDTVQVKNSLWEGHGLELIVLSNEEITAQSPDGKSKYSIK
jgi:hypothetical protein